MEVGCFPLLLLVYAAFLPCLIATSCLKRLHFKHCVVSVNIYEIQKGFGDIKEMVSQDKYTSIRLLNSSYSLQNTKSEDWCCFFHFLLEFYLEKVFNQCGGGLNFYQRRISRIANNFLSIKKELAFCDPVCPCGMGVDHSHKQILSQFQRMDSQSAALKAVGELDILLEWIDKTE